METDPKQDGSNDQKDNEGGSSVSHVKPKQADASSVNEEKDSKSKQEGSNNKEDKEDISSVSLNKSDAIPENEDNDSRSKQEGSKNEEDIEDINSVSLKKSDAIPGSKDNDSRSAQECTKCDDKLAEKDKEIESLQQDLKSKANAMKSIEQKLSSLQKDLEHKESAMKEKEEKLSRLTDEKQLLETELKNEIEKRSIQSISLHTAEKTLGDNKELINSLQKDLEHKESAMKENEEKLSSLHTAERKLDDNKELINSLLRGQEKLLQQLEEKKKEVTRLTDDCSTYKVVLIEKDDRIVNLLRGQEKLLQQLEEKKKEVTRLTDDCSTYKVVLMEKDDTIVNMNMEQLDVKHSISAYESENKRLSVEVEGLRIKLIKETARNEDITKRMKLDKKEITQLKRKELACQKKSQDADAKFARMQSDFKEKDDELKRLRNYLETKKGELKRLQSELENTQKDRDDYQLRLSALISSKLTTNNPEITDLSDINRPTKLAEKWGELYDNEYTDLFEELQCDDEKKIFLILQLLKRSSEICQEMREKGVNWMSYFSVDNRRQNPVSYMKKPKARSEVSKEWVVVSETECSNIDCKEQQLKTGTSDLSSTKQKHSDMSEKAMDDVQQKELRQPQGPQQHHASDQKIEDNEKHTVDSYSQTATSEMVKLDVPDDLMTKFSQYLKKEAEAYLGVLLKELPERVAREFDILWSTGNALDKYLKSCIRLCWLMGIQSPPVYIRFDEHDQGARYIPLDKHVYKEYTKAGQYIDYAVWPPLFLYKDGPLLHRGVAQGTDSKD